MLDGQVPEEVKTERLHRLQALLLEGPQMLYLDAAQVPVKSCLPCSKRACCAAVSGGMTGSARVAKAAPDGSQFVLGNVGTHAVAQTLSKNPPYNVTQDFAPVGLFADLSLVLVTRKDLPAGNLQEFIAYAKANQDKMQFGSASAGSATHLGCALLNAATWAVVKLAACAVPRATTCAVVKAAT